MKSKKLISLICAAAMTTSAFAGLVTTASAATDVFSFNGESEDGWECANGTVVSQADEGETDKYLMIKGGGGAQRTGTFSFGSATSSLTDNYVIEFDSLIHGANGMGRTSNTTQIAFHGSNKAADTRTFSHAGDGVGKGFAVKYDTRKDYQGKGIIINDPADEVISDWTTQPNYVDSIQNKWTRTQAVISGGKATITIIDRAGNKLVDAKEYACDATGLTGIEVGLARGESVPGSGDAADPGYVYLDNIHIYEGAAEALTTDGLRGEAAVETPIPKPDVLTQAPKLIAPSGVTPVVNQDFSASLAKTSMGAEGQTVTSLNGLSIALGGRTDSATGAEGDAGTYVQTADYATGDKVLELVGGRYSTGGRGPVVSAAESLGHADGNVAVMSFAANLTSEALGGAGRLYILGDTRQAGETKDGAYNAVMAVLATDDYVYNEGEGDGSLVIKVEPYKWYKVGVVVSGDKYRVWVAEEGSGFAKDANIQRDHVGQGEANIGVDSLTLPSLAVTSAATSGGTTNSIVRIDNMLTYNTAMVDELRKVLPSEGEPSKPTPTPQPKHNVTVEWDNTAKKATITQAADDTSAEAFDAVLIHAAYDSKGAMTSVTTYDAKNITTDGIEISIPETDVVHTGDKLMVWNSMKDMIPYGVATVEEGEAPVVKYSVTVADTENGTVTVTPSGNVDANTEVEITAAPNEGYEVDTITVKDSANADVAVTETATGAKFTVVDKDVTVTVTFKEKYVAPATYTITGTVDAGVLRVRLVDKADATNAIEATIADGKATAAGVKAGTYTINVGYNGGYEADTITPASGEIEVTADNAEAFAVTSKASQKPAITGTVTITGTPAVGETLTATVNGINDGETPVYEWRAKAEGSDAFVAIADATASTLVLTEAMKGSQIKVVVKSEGTSGQLDSDPTAAVAGVKSAVTVAAATNGTVKVMNGETEVTEAVLEGTSLKVTATPNAGYAVKTITVAPTNTESTTTVTVTDGTFTMPAEAVTVTVEFEYNGVFKITPAMTYVNFQTAEAETSFEGVTPAKAGLVKISGGKFMESAQNYLDTAAMTVISIDASEYLNKIDDAVLTFGGKSNGAGTTVRYGTYSNYIDIASDDVTVSASNVNTLGGTPAIIGDVGAVNTTDVTKLSLNIKDMLKGAADGKVTIVLLTSTGRATDITDPEVTVTAAETAYETATVNVHTVYEDANGAIEANGKKYTEFGTAKTATMYAGDKYTAGHTAVIDDNTKTTRYDYVSGDEEITSVAGNNDIYLVYTKTDYQTVTFTAKIGETATAGVPIKINGTPTVVGEAMTETTVTTGDGEAEGTTAGVATIKLLPGAYNYAIDATATYLAVDATNFTVANEALPVEVVLTANQKASATLKVVYTTDGTAAGKVGEVTVYDAAANKFEDDVVSADDLASYRKVSKFANADGLYALYSYTSGGDQAVTLAGGENVVYITVTASSDTRLFNVYEDFEDGVNKFIDASRTSVYVEDNTVVNSKVQAFKRAGNAQNGYGLASFALPTTLNKAKTTVEFDAYIDGSNSREIISIRAVEGGTTAETTGCSKVTYGSKGVMFNMGQTWSQTALLQGATVDPGLGKWVHVQVIINTTTKKVSYTITEKESGNAVQSATDVAYVDTTTETTNVGYIDVFGGLNNYDKTRIDNIVVINEDAE